MQLLFSIYLAVLFFILTPAVMLRLPKKGDKYTVAAVHALVFAIILHFSAKIVMNFSRKYEGFREGATSQAAKLAALKAACDASGGTWNATTTKCEVANTGTKGNCALTGTGFNGIKVMYTGGLDPTTIGKGNTMAQNCVTNNKTYCDSYGDTAVPQGGYTYIPGISTGQSNTQCVVKPPPAGARKQK